MYLLGMHRIFGRFRQDKPAFFDIRYPAGYPISGWIIRPFLYPAGYQIVLASYSANVLLIQ
jgi:hypothetical protein